MEDIRHADEPINAGRDKSETDTNFRLSMIMIFQKNKCPDETIPAVKGSPCASLAFAGYHSSCEPFQISVYRFWVKGVGTSITPAWYLNPGFPDLLQILQNCHKYLEAHRAHIIVFTLGRQTGILAVYEQDDG